MTISPANRGSRAFSTAKSKAIPATTCTAAISINASATCCAVWRSSCQYPAIELAVQRASQSASKPNAARNRQRLRGKGRHKAAEKTESASAIHGSAGYTSDTHSNWRSSNAPGFPLQQCDLEALTGSIDRARNVRFRMGCRDEKSFVLGGREIDSALKHRMKEFTELIDIR
jgi:hypothetical protein